MKQVGHHDAGPMKRLPVWTVLLACAAAGLVSATAAVPGIAHPANTARHTPLPPRGRTSTGAPAATIGTTTSTTTTTTRAPTPVDAAATAAAVQQAAQGVVPSTQIGFEVFDRQTGAVLASLDPGQQFAAMSAVKLLIALDAVNGTNGALPDAATRQQLRQMLATSDDDIADALWDADGGPALVTRVATMLGLTGTRPPEDPGEWGDTLITARDMVTVYRYVADQLAAPSRDLILDALADAPRHAADGFDQYFGIPDGLPHTSWAIKQGWGTSGDQAVMNSTGLVGAGQRYVTVLLAAAPAGFYGALPQAVTAAAAALTPVVGVAAANP
jgi:hypothetical protein